MRRRPGFVCGAALFLVLSFAADGLVLRVDVTGSAARYAARAEEVLAEAGIGVFSFYSEEAAGRARSRLLAEFADVAFAEVEKSGCIVRVTLEAGEAAEVPARKSELRAPASGEVEELTVLRGEACVEEGQQVAAGDVLVLGRVAGADGAYKETFVSARCVLRCEYAFTAAGGGEEAVRRALAAARLSAERDLRRATRRNLRFWKSMRRRQGGAIARHACPAAGAGGQLLSAVTESEKRFRRKHLRNRRRYASTRAILTLCSGCSARSTKI